MGTRKMVPGPIFENVLFRTKMGPVPIFPLPIFLVPIFLASLRESLLDNNNSSL